LSANTSIIIENYIIAHSTETILLGSEYLYFIGQVDSAQEEYNVVRSLFDIFSANLMPGTL